MINKTNIYVCILFTSPSLRYNVGITHITMNTMADTTKPIVPSFVVQEEGKHKVLVYLNIPELKVKRTFPNFMKVIPSNAHEKIRDFQNQSFTFTINVQTKLYSLSVARLPGEIQPERCSIKYQRAGCWITLFKIDSMPWMNRICDNLTPGLDTQEYDDQPPSPSAPVKDIQLKDTNMPPPFNSIPIAPIPPARTSIKKAPAPPPPTN